MKNLWPDKFEENEKLSVKNILEEQAKILPKLTNRIVFAEVVEMDRLDAYQLSMSNDFSFRLNIYGKFLEGYRFKVLSFSHDITFYPVKFQIDELIAKELGIIKEKDGSVKIVNKPEEVESLLAAVLTCDRMKKVIGSIIKLSK